MESVRPFDSNLYPSAAGLLAKAFYTNSAHVYICPDPNKRLAQLEWFLGSIFRLNVGADLESSFCIANGDVVDAMGFWTRPNAPPIGLFAQIRGGLLAVPYRIGTGGFRRALEVDGEIDRQCRAALGDRSYWYLNNVVVRENLRGTGIGTHLIRDQLRILTGRDSTAPVALSTQREENVTFYGRLGFEVASEEMVGRDQGRFRNWIMVRSTPS